MAPFGPDNLNPAFEAANVTVAHSLTSFKDRHIRFSARQEGGDAVLPAIGFDLAGYYDLLAAGTLFTMVFTVEENVFNGNTSIQLKVKDIRL
jgi:single-stranded-DNA-specific exonuclease